MAVLKIKKDGVWTEVWGATNEGATKLTTITMPAASWTGSASPYSQVVTVSGVNDMSKVDLQPTQAQLVELQANGIALMAVNNNNVVTVYAFNKKPASDMTMQATVMDVTM